MTSVDAVGIAGGIGSTEPLVGGATVSQSLTIDPNTVIGIGSVNTYQAVGILALNQVDPSGTLSQNSRTYSRRPSRLAANENSGLGAAFIHQPPSRGRV